MICRLANYKTDTNKNHPWCQALLERSSLAPDIINAYLNFLDTDGSKLAQSFNHYSNAPQKSITPLIIYNEVKEEITTLIVNNNHMPPEPGEQGSILAYIRAHGFNDELLCSDCYGQLSCSSCAVEVLTGALENPTPREEEYDMLDIDNSKPPTEKTRLGCQAILGSEPLVLQVRAAKKPVLTAC